MVDVDVKPARSAIEGGWHWITDARKIHWFNKSGRALCGRWMTFCPASRYQDEPDLARCTRCQKMLTKVK